MEQTPDNKNRKSERFADNGSPFGYKISNLRDGIYVCLLHFEDTDHYRPFFGKNAFTVSINGVKSENIDVYKMAAGSFIP